MASAAAHVAGIVAATDEAFERAVDEAADALVEVTTTTARLLVAERQEHAAGVAIAAREAAMALGSAQREA